MSYGEQIQNYWTQQLNGSGEDRLPNWVTKKKRLHESRGNKIPRITGQGTVYRSYKGENDETKVEYNLGVTFFVKDSEKFFHEEEERIHQATFYKDTLVEDAEIKPKYTDARPPKINALNNKEERSPRFVYDRRTAVQYAERWWNDYNPEYKKFDVDCTNFISQCLHAGGAPMRGAPNRSEGWWFSGDNWSYSWAVAHSFRWYLSGSNSGLKGIELDNPEDLLPGDVICYDFEGDGKWNHTTIVVDKDKNNMPLVNAHTSNSRHRYWSYEDSYAWTENIQYKFFRIGE